HSSCPPLSPPPPHPPPSSPSSISLLSSSQPTSSTSTLTPPTQHTHTQSHSVSPSHHPPPHFRFSCPGSFLPPHASSYLVQPPAHHSLHRRRKQHSIHSHSISVTQLASNIHPRLPTTAPSAAPGPFRTTPRILPPSPPPHRPHRPQLVLQST
ncbi:hypothetical protein CC85DRAFT_279037, partial [Cutaneotrichosporon oleaginosum]